MAALCLALTDAHAADVTDCNNDSCSEVVVTATRDARSSFDLPLSIDKVDGAQLRDQHLGVNLSESLNRIPGMVAQSRETYAQEQVIILRGFGARSQFGVRGIKLLADGIPASTPDGQGGTGLFDLATAKSIEVMRGGFSSLYGNHSGGVIQILTEDGPVQPTLDVNVATGSSNSQRANTSFGGTSEGINYIGSVSRFASDGYRDWSRAQKDQANVKLKWQSAEGASFTLVGNYLNQPNNLDPLGLSAVQVAANPRQSDPAAQQFATRRNLNNRQGGLVIEMPISATDSVRTVAYSGQRSNEQYLAIPLAAQNAVTSSGGLSAFDRDFYGAGVRWHHQYESASIATGVDYEAAADNRKGWLNNLGNKGALKRDETDIVQQLGAYVQGERTLASNWTASGGLRYTRVSFNSRDHFICTTVGSSCSGSTLIVTPARFNPDDSGAVTYSAWTGALGLLYKLAPSIHIYANVGRSFETPTFTELAYQPSNQSGLNFGLRDSRSNQYEIGIKAFPAADLRVNAALFHTDTANEIVVNTSSGGRTTYRNSGKTTRSGIELSAEATIGYGFSGYASATCLDAVFTDGFAGSSGFVSTGNRIPGTARYTGYGEIVWRNERDTFSSALEARANSAVLVNDINSEAATPYVVTNWRVGFNQKMGNWRFSEFLHIDNLFNRQYVGSIYVNDANSRFYAPAPGRSYMVGASLSLRY